MRVGTILVVIWLALGALAAFQRGYFAATDASCAKVSTIAITVAAGPLNYVGINPRVKECEAPQPSE